MVTVAQNGTLHHNGFMALAQPLGEAPCSINAFVEVPGLGRTQVTGRGTTGIEAAHQLKDGVDALTATFAPPAPQSREARLSALLTCGLTKATAKGDYDLVCRLSKAAALVLSGAVSPGERVGMLAVTSQENASHYYEVDGLACSCPDYERKHRQGHAAYLCKHALASWMSRKLGEGA